MERLTHEADFGLEEWEQTCFLVKSDPGGAYNILDIARYEGEKEFDDILINIAMRLKHQEDLIDHGRMLQLPISLGDTVYTNFSKTGWYLKKENRPYAAKVVFIGISKEPFFNVEYMEGKMWQFNFSDIGKTVFLSWNKANESLKEVNDNDRE